MSQAKTKAVCFTARETAELIDVDRPASPLGPREIEGDTLVSLISPGTEINASYLGTKFPSFGGYAAVMRVTAVGAEVKGVAVGADVFLMGNHKGFQRIDFAAAVPVPAGLSPQTAVFARLMGVSMSTLVTTTARPPSRVLVTGLGPVGHLASQIFAGAGHLVTACDPVESRRRLATTAGIKDVRPAPPANEAEGLGTYSLAVECSGHEAAVLDACRAVRKRGEVVLVGVPWRKRSEIAAFDLLHVVFHKYVVLRSGWEWELPVHPADFRAGSIYENFAGAMRWLGEGRVKVDNLYELVKPADCQRVYQDLLHQRGEKIVSVFDWRG